MWNGFKIRRAAVEVERINKTPQQIELEAISHHRSAFRRLGVAVFVVSFIHMFTALSVYSDGSRLEQFASVAMTGLIDYSTWQLARYIFYVKRRDVLAKLGMVQREMVSERTKWSVRTFSFGLLLCFLLNLYFMWLRTPANESSVQWAINVGIALALSLFIPMLIAVAALIEAELENDFIMLEQDAAKRNALQKQITPNIRVVENDALRSNNEIVTPAQPLPRPSSLKSILNTNDTDGMALALREQGVTFVRTAKELGEILGFSSPASHSKARDTLLAAGVLRGVHGGYEVVYAVDEIRS